MECLYGGSLVVKSRSFGIPKPIVRWFVNNRAVDKRFKPGLGGVWNSAVWLGGGCGCSGCGGGCCDDLATLNNVPESNGVGRLRCVEGLSIAEELGGTEELMGVEEDKSGERLDSVEELKGGGPLNQAAVLQEAPFEVYDSLILSNIFRPVTLTLVALSSAGSYILDMPVTGLSVGVCIYIYVCV